MSRILIVDDEKQIRRILSVLLAEGGHAVLEAETGEEALTLQPEFQPNIILLDISLPGMGGMEVLQKLLERAPQADCIMMTAFGTIRSAVEAMRLGAFDYLAKPFDNDELLLIIDRALRMRSMNAELEDLRTELEARYGFNEIVGISPPMREVFRIMAKVAGVDATVLIAGESGTGKGLVARALHRRSRRAAAPFVAVNCSAIPQDLIEAEFFGHRKGAFTGARESREGRFELAAGGSLFLDEVGDLSLEAQAKLLRALQEHEVTPVGGREPVPVDVRVIAATNKDLERAVRKGEFREDLFWRINVVNIKLPPLRDRIEDLPLLVDHLLDRFQSELKLAVKSVSPAARQLLLHYDWPGNVRELENTLCRSMILCDSHTLMPSDLPPRIRGEMRGRELSHGVEYDTIKLADAVKEATERLEKMLIISRLAQHHDNRTATAESLGISRKTLFNKMRDYHMDVTGVGPGQI